MMPVGLLIQHEQSILFANKATCRFLNRSCSELIGQHFLDFVGMSENGNLSTFFQNTLASDIVQHTEPIEIPDAHGNPRYYRAIGARLPWNGTPVSQIILQDITVQLEKEVELNKLLMQDPLTGAQNRRSFISYAEQLLQDDNARSCGIIFFDVDKFKKVNDTFGHESGDEALKKIVQRTQTVLDNRDINEEQPLPPAMLARMGGEEFAVIVPRTKLAGTAALAVQIRIEVAARSIVTREHNFDITVSLGVTCADLDSCPIGTVLREADTALYAAKKNGRDCVVIAGNVRKEDAASQQHFISRKQTRT